MGRSAFATDKSLLELTEEVKMMKSVIQTMSLELVKGSVPPKKDLNCKLFSKKGPKVYIKINLFFEKSTKNQQKYLKSLDFQGRGGEGVKASLEKVYILIFFGTIP